MTILICAAGYSSRMAGADKLLEDVGGIALLRDRAQAALAACPRVCVALPVAARARLAALSGLPVAVVEVPDAAEGMAAALRAGALAAGAQPGLLVMLGDMPEITAADLRRLISAFDGESIIRAASADGVPGHPVIFPADCLPAFADLTGDRGARDILAAHKHRIKLMPLEGIRALVDLDTPEAWAAWRAKRKNPPD
ncbi:nucleotidyltransferase family protein [Oceaniglobus ichthyenteri]|uniref:nucleotidyltransferase family protein n=1 Tax=Oceaniglobus ichthyenteri TaxID=2136177 RepID=UPI0030B83B4A